MEAVIARLGELLRPSSASPPADPIRTLTIDLLVATIGFGIFGASIAGNGDATWTLLVAGKIAAMFLVAFILSLPPLYSLKRFFDADVEFAPIVSAFASHLALGGIFVSAAAGIFLLLRRGDIDFDGTLAIGFVAAAVLGVMVC